MQSGMDIDEGPSFDWVESSAVSEINANFESTFCHNPEDSKLQITRFYEIVEENGGDREKCCVHDGPLVFPEDIKKAAVCWSLFEMDLDVSSQMQGTTRFVSNLCHLPKTLPQ
jgi:hypothetical protein